MGRERNFFERTNFLGNLEIISWNISKFVRTYKLTKISGSLYVYTYKLPNILVSLYVRTNLLDVQTYSNIYIMYLCIDTIEGILGDLGKAGPGLIQNLKNLSLISTRLVLPEHFC